MEKSEEIKCVIKKSFLGHVKKYAMNTKLDLNGEYTLAEWKAAGFGASILEKSKK